MKSHGHIIVNNNKIYARKLLSSAKKVVLSNVSAVIPNEVLQTYITQNLGFKLVSPISILRVHPLDEEFGHIVSWRRQVYVSNLEDIKCPNSFLLSYNDRDYRIFVTCDDLVCFKCNSTGHKASECTRNGDSWNMPNVEANIKDIVHVEEPLSEQCRGTIPIDEPLANSVPVLLSLNRLLLTKISDTKLHCSRHRQKVELSNNTSYLRPQKETTNTTHKDLGRSQFYFANQSQWSPTIY